MPDAQTLYELRLACHKAGCPVCTLVQRAGARYIEGTFSESMLDPVIRQKLVDSQGFCYKHTWLSINLKLSDSLGHAILYQDLVTNMLRRMDENAVHGNNSFIYANVQNNGCPACRIESETVERVIESMRSALRNADFIDEYSQSSGLCLKHLQELLPVLDTKRRKVILDHQRSCLEALKDELAEFIRKSDYRFQDEQIGKEGDSYKRAADILHGKHQPAEKRELR